MKRIFALVLAALMLLSMTALAEESQPAELSVTGSGTVYMAADIATASLGVCLNGKDLETLQKQANETISAICAAMKQAGLADQDISTNYIYINPTYDYSSRGGTERIVGYSITNTLTIRTEDIDKIGAYIDAAFAAGANSFDSISFTVADDSAARRQALELAVQDARSKAETIALASGKTLGDMLRIAEGSQNDYAFYNSTSGSVSYARAEAADVAGFGSTVRAAQVKVTADVQISYELN